MTLIQRSDSTWKYLNSKKSPGCKTFECVILKLIENNEKKDDDRT